MNWLSPIGIQVCTNWTSQNHSLQVWAFKLHGSLSLQFWIIWVEWFHVTFVYELWSLSTHQKLRSPAWKFSYYLSLDGTETFLLFPVVDNISPCLILIIASSEIKIIHVTSGLLNKWEREGGRGVLGLPLLLKFLVNWAEQI